MAAAVGLRDDFTSAALRQLAQSRREGVQVRRLLADAIPTFKKWSRLVDQPWRIMPIGLRQWAHG